MATNLNRRTTTGLHVAGPRYLKSIALQGGSAASSVVVDDSTDGSGTDLIVLACPANESANWSAGDEDGVLFRVGIHSTLAGTGAAVAVEYA